MEVYPDGEGTEITRRRKGEMTLMPDESDLCTEEDWERSREERMRHVKRAYTDELFERDAEEELTARARRQADDFRCAYN